jgi:hypothetical protein
MTSERDPWADLAESLGATPNAEPQPPQAAEPPRPKPAPQPAQPRPRPATTGDWDGLASDLGVEGGRTAGSEPPRPSQEASPPRRPAEDRPVRERRAEPPRHDTRDSREPHETSGTPGWADEVVADRGEGGDRAEQPSRDRDDSGECRERRGRRRRGRRGGRGRREGDRPVDERGDRHDLPGVMADDLDRPQEPRAADFDGDGNERRDDLASDAPLASGTDGEGDGEGDGDPPARRRRRGRRGGRRRGRSTRERLAGERLAAEKPESEQRLDDLEDEPLATGYGATPRPAASSRTESSRSTSGGEGERRGRRRRRRGGSSGESSSTTSRREPGRESERRRGSDSSRSSSRSDRGRRRDDFAPVAGRFDEDDEGLEFLGVEDAGRASQGSRERRPTAPDESIAESGLDTVREVPSWVEAIGIVIAANLDARDKSTGGRK